jgi:hypothetical protein
MLDGKTNPRV